jgi:AraC-like DNA-binding protein
MRTSTGGFPRKLDRKGIERVMRWHCSEVRFRQRQGTLASFARSLNLSVHELQRALKGRLGGLALSPQQRQNIRRWETRRRRFHKVHPTAAALARWLGISRSTLFLCIQKNGTYRTGHKSDGISERGASRGRRKAQQHGVTSALIRGWRRAQIDEA